MSDLWWTKWHSGFPPSTLVFACSVILLVLHAHSVIYQSLMLYKTSKLQHQTTYLKSLNVHKLTLCSCPRQSSAASALYWNTTFYHPMCCKECRTVWSPCAWLPLETNNKEYKNQASEDSSLLGHDTELISTWWPCFGRTCCMHLQCTGPQAVLAPQDAGKKLLPN